MKKFICIMLAFLTLLTVASCGEASRESAETAVKNAFDAVKSLDEENIEKYFGENIIEDVWNDNLEVSEELLEDDTAKTEEIAKLLVKNLTYKIVKVTEDGDNATAEVEITNLNMTEIMTSFLMELFTSALDFSAQDSQTEELSDEMLEKLVELMNKGAEDKENGYVTNSVTLTMKYSEEKNWKIDVSVELVNAIAGGLLSFAEEIGDAFSSF